MHSFVVFISFVCFRVVAARNEFLATTFFMSIYSGRHCQQNEYTHIFCGVVVVVVGCVSFHRIRWIKSLLSLGNINQFMELQLADFNYEIPFHEMRVAKHPQYAFWIYNALSGFLDSHFSVNAHRRKNSSSSLFFFSIFCTSSFKWQFYAVHLSVSIWSFCILIQKSFELSSCSHILNPFKIIATHFQRRKQLTVNSIQKPIKILQPQKKALAHIVHPLSFMMKSN